MTLTMAQGTLKSCLRIFFQLLSIPVTDLGNRGCRPRCQALASPALAFLQLQPFQGSWAVSTWSPHPTSLDAQGSLGHASPAHTARAPPLGASPPPGVSGDRQVLVVCAGGCTLCGAELWREGEGEPGRLIPLLQSPCPSRSLRILNSDPAVKPHLPRQENGVYFLQHLISLLCPLAPHRAGQAHAKE